MKVMKRAIHLLIVLALASSALQARQATPADELVESAKLFIDRLSALKRDSYKRRIRKMIRDGVSLDDLPSRPNSEVPEV